jgi:hypothetical protein
MSVANILPRGRRRRLVNGTVLAVLAVATAVWMVLAAEGPFWGVLVFLLVWLAGMMLLQAREHT